MESNAHENGVAVSTQPVAQVEPDVSLYSKVTFAIPEIVSLAVPLSVIDPRSGVPGLLIVTAVGTVASDVAETSLVLALSICWLAPPITSARTT